MRPWDDKPTPPDVLLDEAKALLRDLPQYAVHRNWTPAQRKGESTPDHESDRCSLFELEGR